MALPGPPFQGGRPPPGMGPGGPHGGPPAFQGGPPGGPGFAPRPGKHRLQRHPIYTNILCDLCSGSTTLASMLTAAFIGRVHAATYRGCAYQIPPVFDRQISMTGPSMTP